MRLFVSAIASFVALVGASSAFAGGHSTLDGYNGTGLPSAHPSAGQYGSAYTPTAVSARSASVDIRVQANVGGHAWTSNSPVYPTGNWKPTGPVQYITKTIRVPQVVYKIKTVPVVKIVRVPTYRQVVSYKQVRVPVTTYITKQVRVPAPTQHRQPVYQQPVYQQPVYQQRVSHNSGYGQRVVYPHGNR